MGNIGKGEERFCRWVNLLLEALEGSWLKKDNKGSDHITVYRDVSFFSPVEPLMDSVASSSLAVDYDRMFFMDVKPGDIGDWDVSTLSRNLDEEEPDIRFRLTRFRRVPLRELRGVPIRSSWVGAMTCGFIHHDESFWSAELLFNWVAGEWVLLKPVRWRTKGVIDIGNNLPRSFHKLDDEGRTAIQVALGIAFTRDYEWTVEIGKPGGLKVRMVTDAEGSKEFFRMREPPTIDSRRAALQNWVRQHWRRQRTFSADETKVRQHLRGATSFSWGGYECEIIPSSFDLRKNEELRIAREREKSRVREWAQARYGGRAASWQ